MPTSTLQYSKEHVTKSMNPLHKNAKKYTLNLFIYLFLTTEKLTVLVVLNLLRVLCFLNSFDLNPLL